MDKNRSIGLLSGILKATEEGALTGLARFTPEEVAPKLARFLNFVPSERQIGQSLWYAKRQGFLATQERAGTLAVTLTYKGREHLLRLRRLGIPVAHPKDWDGKWRLVTFDIPERRRYARDTFRQALKRIGFKKLEGSLWIYPFDCRAALATVAEALLIAPHIRFYLVESFDGEDQFREAFALSPTENPRS
jgi:DNA-binding transcriptional regulator PaaX